MNSTRRSRGAALLDQQEQRIIIDRDVAGVDRRCPSEVIVQVEGIEDTYNEDVQDTPPDDSGSAELWREADVRKEEEAARDYTICSRIGASSNIRGGYRGKNRRNDRPAPAITQDRRQLRSVINGFMHPEQAANVEHDKAIDMNVDMEEPKSFPPSASAFRELNVVSFRRQQSDIDMAHAPASSDDDDKEEENIDGGASVDDDGYGQKTSSDTMDGNICNGRVPKVVPSSTAFQRRSVMLRAKTRSRLMDPPAPAPLAPMPVLSEDTRKSAKLPKSGQIRSGALKSGLLGKSQRFDEDDDEPFMDEDIPDELKRAKCSCLTVLQWLGLVLILAALICSLSVPTLARRQLWRFHLWKWELLVLVLICGRLVSGWVVKLVVFLIERNFVLRKRVLYFVYGVRKAVQNCIWLGLVILPWHYMLDGKVEDETKSSILPYVTKILFCLLVATLFWLAKTLLVKVLALSFHVSNYFDRIQEAVFNQYVIETLSGPPMIESRTTRRAENMIMAEMQKLESMGVRIPDDLKAAALQAKSGSASPAPQKSARIDDSSKQRQQQQQQQQQDDQDITIEKLTRLNQKNVSAWNMKRLMTIVRHGTLTTLDERISEEYGKDKSVTGIQSEYEAKVVAKKLFHNVATPGSKYIYLYDVLRFMREDDAIKTMSLFEGVQEKNRVCKRSLTNWVVNAFRDRKTLSLTLNDTKTVVNKLHHMINVIISIIVFSIWLLILGIANTHFFLFLGPQILVVVFIFGNTLKTVFEALVFLFIMHPFDVGDHCEIDGIQMIVEEMNIMTTIFLRHDNQKISYPNRVLATKSIGNFRRSPDMSETIEFCVDVATPMEKIGILRDKIIGFIENKKEHWHSSPSIVLRELDHTNRLKISIWMRHRINFQDMSMRWARRELVVKEMIKILKELGIKYRMLPPNVNAHNMPVIASLHQSS